MKVAEKKEAKEPKGNPELGLKLMNFRKKLGFAIGQKKITQQEFAEMFGVPSGRALASYELGDSEAPASLIYRFWQHGNSIDHIFGDGPITDAGRETANELYQKSLTASVKDMSDEEQERVLAQLEEKKHAEGKQKAEDKRVTSRDPSNGAGSHTTPRKIKKR